MQAAFVGEMRDYASKLVSTVKSSTETYRHDNLTKEKCPVWKISFGG